jgi:hypothetical protein
MLLIAVFRDVVRPRAFAQAVGQSQKNPTEPGPAVKPAKTEPFAFADWIWLNDNLRTKQPLSTANSSRRRSVLVVDQV